MSDDKAPKFSASSFRCLHCTTVAQQSWFAGRNASDRIFKAMQIIFNEYRSHLQNYEQDAIKDYLQHMQRELGDSFKALIPSSVGISICGACNDPTIWVGQEVVYPSLTLVDTPNQDLDPEIIKIYAEASSIVHTSPRGAAALIRLALQKLLIQIGKDGKNINDNIKELVSEGLPATIQKALDLLRVVGNNAVHPGQIAIEDNLGIAIKLFHVLNLIAYEMITKPKEISSLYEEVVPEDAKQHIKKRDGSIT